MSSLPAGNYQIVWIPQDTSLSGSLFATGEDVASQVLAKPLNSTAQQIWGVQPTGNKDNTYSITFPKLNTPGGPGPVIPGWSVSKNAVNLNFGITEWVISPVDYENNVYQITQANSSGPPGAVFVQKDELFVSPEGVSQWRFIAVNTDSS